MEERRILRVLKGNKLGWFGRLRIKILPKQSLLSISRRKMRKLKQKNF